MKQHFSKLPAVDNLLSTVSELEDRIDRKFMKIIAAQLLDDIRKSPSKWALKTADRDTLLLKIGNELRSRIKQISTPGPSKVINGTGVILHTGLGRAPISEIESGAAGWCDLEFNLNTGNRGQRLSHVVPLLQLLTGAEDAVVVNNNAAAVMLMLSSLARRKEVIVSRGELVEIGGSFRLPEVMKLSGAKLVEVGATNKTHLADYEQAISGRTGAIMLVHPSNYEIVGFTEKPEISEIIALAKSHDIPVIFDLGSGALVDMQQYGFPYEAVASDMISAGFDLISFSGDKLLGGPQAGIIVGKQRWIKKLRSNHLLRALRCDKLTLSHLRHNLQ